MEESFMEKIKISRRIYVMVENQEYTKYHSKSILQKTLNTLYGILIGINIDDIININELEEFKNWYFLNKSALNFHPFNEIFVIIEEAIKDDYLSNDELDDILYVCNTLQNLESSKYYKLITTEIQKLHGIIYGVLADNIITDDEIYKLKNWIIEHDTLKNTYPYEEIYSLLLSILSDNIITDEEKKILKLFFSDFIDTTTSYNLNQIELDTLKNEVHIDGICIMNPTIEIKNNLFCFTGTSSKTTRKGIAELITNLGGIYKDSVVNGTKYLIVGNESNPCWCFSCYGRKIQKAMDLRKKGKDILIVHENDFWDAVNEIKK